MLGNVILSVMMLSVISVIITAAVLNLILLCQVPPCSLSLCWMSRHHFLLYFDCQFCHLEILVELGLVDRTTRRWTTGQLINTSGNWSTINKLVDWIYPYFDQFVYSQPVVTSINKLTSCPLTSCPIDESPLHRNLRTLWKAKVNVDIRSMDRMPIFCQTKCHFFHHWH